MTPSAGRRLEARLLELAAPAPRIAETEDLELPGPREPIHVRVYRPVAQPAHLPLVIFLHGGGWVVGDIDIADGHARRFADGGECIVISVGYRLAPEHPFPEPLEDAYAAALWAHGNAEALGGDPNRLAVAGESSGANLAAGLALLARDRGAPPLRFQLLIVPALLPFSSLPSYRRYGNGYGLDTSTMEWCWRQYLASDIDRANPYAAPLRASDLKALPATFILTAELDPLRDEGETYAQRLRDAGVPVETSRFDGMVHSFMAFSAIVEEAETAFKQCGAILRANTGGIEEVRSAEVAHVGRVSD